MKIIYIFILFLINHTATGQKYILNGYITDIDTGEKIIGAFVSTENNSEHVFSNEYGYYNLVVKTNKDSISIKISMVGYKTHTEIINISDKNQKNFHLKFKNEIQEIVITGENNLRNVDDVNTINLSVKQAKILPSIGSEPDVFKSLQLKPGILNGKEGSSNLIVRGGGTEENLILLDDVPLYYVNHLGGYISIFNINALKNVKLIKGGFPANYSGRLSSVVDVRMKDGNNKNFEGSYSASIINSSFSFEGPIIKDKSSFIFSFRILPWELIYRPIISIFTEGLNIGYNFYDINAKLNYKINDKNYLNFSFYTGYDNINAWMSDNDKDEKLRSSFNWGNYLAAIKWNHIFNKKTEYRCIAAYTIYKYANDFDFLKSDENFKYSFTTNIKDVVLKNNFAYKFSNNYNIKFGLNSTFHFFNPWSSYYTNQEAENNLIVNDEKIKALENNLFIENHLKLYKFLRANIGFNISSFNSDKLMYSFQPRMILSFLMSKKHTFNLSYSQMSQYVHLLSNSSSGLPIEFWIPVINNIKPANSEQYTAGIKSNMGNFIIEADIYVKESKNILAFKEGTVLGSFAENWQNKIEHDGVGNFYGFEFLLEKNKGKLTGWLAYTFAKAENQFSNINSGEKFPYKYDRRHNLNFVAIYKFNKSVSLSVNQTYGSGYPFTMPISTYQAYDSQSNMSETIFIYSDKNSYRMKPYHRLDIALSHTKTKKKGVRTWSLNIYNVYNQQNPYYYFFVLENDKYLLYQQSLFPIIPSISYSYKF